MAKTCRCQTCSPSAHLLLGGSTENRFGNLTRRKRRSYSFSLSLGSAHFLPLALAFDEEAVVAALRLDETLVGVVGVQVRQGVAKRHRLRLRIRQGLLAVRQTTVLLPTRLCLQRLLGRHRADRLDVARLASRRRRRDSHRTAGSHTTPRARILRASRLDDDLRLDLDRRRESGILGLELRNLGLDVLAHTCLLAAVWESAAHSKDQKFSVLVVLRDKRGITPSPLSQPAGTYASPCVVMTLTISTSATPFRPALWEYGFSTKTSPRTLRPVDVTEATTSSTSRTGRTGMTIPTFFMALPPTIQINRPPFW